MKATKYSISILIVATISWIGFHLYNLSNDNFDFSDFKQIPIAFGFLISLILYLISRNRKLISFLFYGASCAILGLGLFSNISVELLFKIESIILLFFGAFALNSIGKAKHYLFTAVFFCTAALFSLSLVLEISTSTLQFAQMSFGILSTLFALISFSRRTN
jgi:hypothetical protein